MEISRRLQKAWIAFEGGGGSLEFFLASSLAWRGLILIVWVVAGLLHVRGLY